MGLAFGLALLAGEAGAAEPEVVIPAPEGGSKYFGIRGLAHLEGELFVGDHDVAQVHHYVVSNQSYVYDTAIEAPSYSPGFGRSIAADSTYIVIGAVEHNLDNGRVHLYVRMGGGFAEVDMVESPTDNDQLGYLTLLEGTTALVVAAGGVHVYDISAGTLNEVQVLTDAGWTGDFDQDTFITVVNQDTDSKISVFVRQLDTFALEADLDAADFEAFSSFFGGIAVDGDTILAAVETPSLAVAVFERTDGVWSLTQTVDALDSGLYKGDFLALQPPLAVVDAGIDPGTFLALQDGAWVAQGTVPGFSSISFSDTRLALGAFRSLTNDDPGEVFVFTNLNRALKGQLCATEADCLSGLCVDGVCCTTACEDVCQGCSVAAGAVEDGECSSLPATACCRDDSDCASDQRCSEEKCVPECTTDAECDDGEPCTMDRCLSGCVYELIVGCEVETSDGSAGSESGGGSASGGGTDGATAGVEQPMLSGGCGCVASRPGRRTGPWMLLLLLCGVSLRRRASRRRRRCPHRRSMSGTAGDRRCRG
jgi:hypothetical protein